jgi:flagellar hook protein FlgE
MASDITEEFQVDITNQSAASVPVQNNDITYDIAFNGQGFFDASNPQNPYRRQTAQYKKDQNDNSAEPGEQTLTGWWLRSQSSFHFGAGIDFYEPSQEQSYVQNQTIRFRYKNSEGVNVWEPARFLC